MTACRVEKKEISWDVRDERKKEQEKGRERKMKKRYIELVMVWRVFDDSVEYFAVTCFISYRR